MNVEQVLDLANHVMSVAFEISLPILALSMIIGIIVAIFQAATQIQESSLAFVPKLIGMGIALLIFGNWIIDKLMTFTLSMFDAMAKVSGG